MQPDVTQVKGLKKDLPAFIHLRSGLTFMLYGR